eukprot:1167005-Pleurochrysis_carterae.AAC.6
MSPRRLKLAAVNTESAAALPCGRSLICSFRDVLIVHISPSACVGRASRGNRRPAAPTASTSIV